MRCYAGQLDAAARSLPVRCYALCCRDAGRRRRRPNARCAACASRLHPPHATPYHPHDRPRPPRERASVLNRGDHSPLYTPLATKGHEAKWRETTPPLRGRHREVGCSHISCTQSGTASSRREGGRSLPLSLGQRPGAISPFFFLWATNS
jgi:hypothetical protein